MTNYHLPIAPPPRRALGLVSLTLLAAYAAMTAYFVAAPRMGWPKAIWLMHVSPFAFSGFALIHAGLILGWRQALAFWSISFVVSLAFESLGVLTGWPFGAYGYSHILGWKIFGLVPAIIPLAWFMMMYSTHCLVNVIAGASRGEMERAATPGGAAWLALLSAVAMTAWDLSLDPEMVRRGAWAWETPGPYFGIPLSNYAGWLLTTFVVFLLYRLYALRRPAHPPAAGWFAHLPVAAYAVTWLGEVTNNLLNLEPAIGLISFFAMGGFVFAALVRLWQDR